MEGTRAVQISVLHQLAHRYRYLWRGGADLGFFVAAIAQLINTPFLHREPSESMSVRVISTQQSSRWWVLIDGKGFLAAFSTADRSGSAILIAFCQLGVKQVANQWG
jgi:hypothetical protein